jgi:hypothetical protein
VPVNDDCINAIELESEVPVVGNTCCNNPEMENLCAPFNQSSYGQWFKMNSGECHTWVIKLLNESGSMVGMAVYEDVGNPGCDSLNTVACAPLVTGFYEGNLSAFLNLSPDTDYYFYVYTIDEAGCGAFQLEVKCGIFGCPDPFPWEKECFHENGNMKIPGCPCFYEPCEEAPANNFCQNAIPLNCGDSDVEGSIACTFPDGPVSTECHDDLGAGCWFTFEGDGSIHTIRTCDYLDPLYSSAASEIYIFTSSNGTCSGALSCAQDAVTGEYITVKSGMSYNSVCSSLGSDDAWVEFISEPGEIYFIYVSGGYVIDGSFQISHDCMQVIEGCTSTTACNYMLEADVDDGSCEYISCLCPYCEESEVTHLEMTMTDSFGDGWSGATYTITDSLGDTVAKGSIDDAQIAVDIDVFHGNEYGIDYICLCGTDCYSISVGGGPFDDEISWSLSDLEGNLIVEGMGLSSAEFCNYELIEGCTDPTACNYNMSANTDDGTCELSGCTNEIADNYNPEAFCDDGSCFVFGDLNGDLEVNTSDLLILLSQLGCNPDCVADLNDDGYVNIMDLLLFLGVF